MDIDTSSTITSLSSFRNTNPELLEAIRNPDIVACQDIQDKYNEILDKLKTLSDASGEGGCSTEQLTAHLTDVNEVFGKVKRANEARIDARVLKQVSILGKANIEKTQSCFLTFKPAEFAENLARYLDNSDEILANIFNPESSSLDSLSKEFSCLYRSTDGLEPMYGALDWEPPERAPRETQRRREDLENNIVAKKIEKVADSRTDEENQTEEVDRIYSVLRRRVHENGKQPIPFLEFVIDPKCFSTTVQNIFHTSFLIRDKRAEFSFDKYKIPYISHVKRQTDSRMDGIGSDCNRQSVIEMNVDLWEEAIKLLNIKEAMIPNVSRTLKRSHK